MKGKGRGGVGKGRGGEGEGEGKGGGGETANFDDHIDGIFTHVLHIHFKSFTCECCTKVVYINCTLYMKSV